MIFMLLFNLKQMLQIMLTKLMKLTIHGFLVKVVEHI